MVFLVATLAVFLPDIIERGGNYLANHKQDEFDIHLSDVETDLYPLRATSRVTIRDRKTRKLILETDEARATVSFSGWRPVLDLSIKDLSIDLTKEILRRKKNKSAQTTGGPPGILRHLGNVELTNVDFSLTDGVRSLLTHLVYFEIDFVKGVSSLKGIRAATGSHPRLLEIDDIDLGFSTDSLLEGNPAGVDARVNGARVILAQRALEELKRLTSFPEKPARRKRPGFLHHLSFIELKDGQLELPEKKITGSLTNFSVNFNDHSAGLSELEAFLPGGKRFLRVPRASAEFTLPEGAGTQPALRAIVSGVRLTVTKKLIATLKKSTSPGNSKGPLPVAITSLLIGSGQVNLPDYPGIGKQRYLQIRGIFGHLDHLSLRKGTPLARFNLNATFEGKERLIVQGKLDLSTRQPRFTVDYKIFDLMTKKLNKDFLASLPLTFKAGEIDVLGRAMKRGDKIVGYFKPFLVAPEVIGNNKDFKSPQHLAFEVGTSITEWIFENSKTDTVAATVPFVVKDGHLDFKTGAALWSAVEHGVLESKRVKAHPQEKNMKQAQEAAE